MRYNLLKMREEEAYSVILSLTNSYLYYHTSRYYQDIVNKLLRETKGEWEEAIRWWVSNTARAMGKNANGFTFSARAEVYSHNKQGISYRKVMNLLDFLEKKGYIHIYTGGVLSWSYENGQRIPNKTISSCLVFRDRAIEMWDNIKVDRNLWSHPEDDSLAIIRDRATKTLKPTKGVRGIARIKKEVKDLNTRLTGANIMFEGKPVADVMYQRIFSDDLSAGGRLYSVNGGVQLLPQQLRKEGLLIEGEGVVELDFSALHPNICYELLNSQEGLNVREVIDPDFHPYGADISFTPVNKEMKEYWESKYGKEHNPLRSLNKLAILIAMNSRDEESAAWALGRKVREDREKEEGKQLLYAVEEVNYSRVLKMITRHNELIADYLFSDQGIFLQVIDSRILMNIVGLMGEKGHTTLCYHDSVIVKESVKDDLREAMETAWETELGGKEFCIIEEK